MPQPSTTPQTRQTPLRLVVIAASAGGFEALSELLGALPQDFPLPIAVVLHRSPRDQDPLPMILGRKSRLRIAAVRQGDTLQPGTVHIAPADLHMRVNPDMTIELSDGQRIRHLRSSANPLFESAGESLKGGTIAVVLTGTGRDATDGVQSISSQGGIVIAQDKLTSRHFDMPASAIATGAVSMVLPLEKIAPTLVRLANES